MLQQGRRVSTPAVPDAPKVRRTLMSATLTATHFKTSAGRTQAGRRKQQPVARIGDSWRHAMGLALEVLWSVYVHAVDMGTAWLPASPSPPPCAHTPLHLSLLVRVVEHHVLTLLLVSQVHSLAGTE